MPARQPLERPRTHRARRARLLVAVVALLALAASCDIHRLVPSGDAPLRYRDEIFAGVTKTSNVAYGSAVNEAGDTQTLLLDVYQPTGDTVTAGRPAIVWVHGGSFRAGSKSSGEIVDQANVFARKGYVNVAINYRLSSVGCVPGAPPAVCTGAITNAKHDAQAAVRYLRANAASLGIDPALIAIAGTSAGAITAINVGYSPDEVGSSGNPGFPSDVRAAVSLSGAALTTAPNPGEASVLLFHGTNDPLVPYSLATGTVNGAKSVGLSAFLTTWEGQGHVPYANNRAQIINETTNFLYHTLMLGLAPR
jgi:pimeloyl-ACP methyl ester carboxylesterase